MTTSLWILIAVIFVLICLSAFFSGSETALTAVSRARLMSYTKNGDARAKIVQSLIETKDRLIGALLIGNNLVNILASSLATTAFLGLFGQSGVAYATIGMTILVVIFAEVLPKSAALANPDRFALAVARPVSVVVTILGPLIGIVNWIVRKLLTLLGAHTASSDSILTAHQELRGAVEVLHREGGLVHADRERLGGLLDLHELEVSDVMIHRTGMRQINADDAPAEVVRQVLESPHTRMPVWSGHTDNIIGIIHAKDILRALHEVGNDPEKIDIRKICTRPYFVPETTTLQDQLNAFLRRRLHFAIVVDEYGEVEGLITLEDILEEIVGNIADEHDVEMHGVTTEADGSVVVDGSVPIRDLNRALKWQLPDEEAVTIAGLVIHETQSIPEERQAFTFFEKRFTVLKREKNRIARLRIRPATVLVPSKRPVATPPTSALPAGMEAASEASFEAHHENAADQARAENAKAATFPQDPGSPHPDPEEEAVEAETRNETGEADRPKRD